MRRKKEVLIPLGLTGRLVTTVALVFACLLPALAFTTSAETKEEIIAKRVSVRHGRFLFDPHVTIDWAATARTHFKEFDLDKPDPDAIRKSWFEPGGGSFFTYDAPLPAYLREGVYYLLSQDGVHRLRLMGLVGDIYYQTNRQQTVVGKPSFYGSVSASVDGSTPRGAGFVLIAESNTEFVFKQINARPGDAVPRVALERPDVLIFADGKGRRWTTKVFSLRQESIAAAYQVNTADRNHKYLFIRWGPIHFCEEFFSLLALDGEMVELDWNGHGCDV